MWKSEHISNELGYPAKEISKQSIAWFLPAYRKYEERHKLREELLNIKELGLDYFEKSQLVHIAKDTEVKK